MYFTIKGSTTHSPDNRELSDKKIDELHKRRLFLEESMRPGLLSKDKMWQHDCKDEHDEEKRVNEYMSWQKRITKTGRTNEQNAEELHEINREFKRRGKEGKVFNLDTMRTTQNVKYE